MPHHDRPLPFQFADDCEDVTHIGIDGIVLARAPAGFAKAALVEGGNFPVGGERFGDGDPVVGIEIVGAVHEQDGRAPARTECAVEDRYVAGIHPSVALHGWRLPIQFVFLAGSPYYTRTAVPIRHPEVPDPWMRCCNTISASSAIPPWGSATKGLMSTDCTMSARSTARRPSATSASTTASTSYVGAPR